MFVLEALVLTFMTTPLVTMFYPPHVRTRVSATGANFDNVSDDEARAKKAAQIGDGKSKRRFTVVLDKLEHLPGAMALAQLIQPSTPVNTKDTKKRSSTESRISSKAGLLPPPLSIEALRLIELSDRTSAVMKSSASDILLHTDPLLAIFKMYGQLNDLPITPSMSIVPYDDLSHSVAEHARHHASDMIMIPWLPPSKDGSAQADVPPSAGTPSTPRFVSNNPFEMLFKSAANGIEKPASAVHSQFVRGVFAQSHMDVALFVDRTDARAGAGALTGGSQHVFLPFFGGPDDRLALEFVVQICENPRVTATVLRMVKKDVEVVISPVPAAHTEDDKGGGMVPEANMLTVASVGFYTSYCFVSWLMFSLQGYRRLSGYQLRAGRHAG